MLSFAERESLEEVAACGADPLTGTAEGIVADLVDGELRDS
jgi:hypothetical protein